MDAAVDLERDRGGQRGAHPLELGQRVGMKS